MSSANTSPDEFRTGNFRFVYFKKKTSAGKSHDNLEVIVFKKLRFQNAIRPHESENSAFSNSRGLKSVLEKLRFRAGLVWTVGLTVEIKLRFQIPRV